MSCSGAYEISTLAGTLLLAAAGTFTLHVEYDVTVKTVHLHVHSPNKDASPSSEEFYSSCSLCT